MWAGPRVWGIVWLVLTVPMAPVLAQPLEPATPPPEQPTAEQPTAEQPTAEQPTAEQPTAEQPTAEQPAAAKQPAAAEQPPAAEPVTRTSSPVASDELCAQPPSLTPPTCEQPAIIWQRKWAAWKPWATLGAGAAVVGLGALLQLKAQSDFDQYGDEISQQCGETGCTPDMIPQATRDLESRARLENRLAITAMILGGVGVIGGFAWAMVNYPRPVEAPRPATVLAPTLVPGGAGLAVTGRF